MRGLIKTLGNAALVIGGFFVVFFGISKVPSQSNENTSFLDTAGGVANADAPVGDSAGDSAADSGGDSGDCAGDSGGDSGK